ncbi:segregation and condensation protein A [Suttonella ornithocola]|uniref:Segregation and condensation protein A n=1 Tax=Suttonella ornithocola TaxID=279832 RepID=A0A380MQP6_9GAMM|nr:segregation/condensation protein A [Suttonella ornithocola]SUO94233.1 Segregation and condensation protein A [Suttonella ornithocola]
MQKQILVFGEPIETLPKDLYIPPDALRVLLETFEGPLDLLLYLIRKDNMDIRDIQVAVITEQYLAYMKMMEALDISLAAEYLLMAATLAEIKARMLLPQVENDEAMEEEDPRAALTDRLLAYAQTVKAAEKLAAWARVEDGIALSAYQPPEGIVPIIKPNADTEKLLQTIAQIWRRQALKRAHEVEKEAYSLAERIAKIEAQILAIQHWQPLVAFYHHEEGKAGLVISLMAMLELDRSQRLEWQQAEAFADIFIRPRRVMI